MQKTEHATRGSPALQVPRLPHKSNTDDTKRHACHAKDCGDTRPCVWQNCVCVWQSCAWKSCVRVCVTKLCVCVCCVCVCDKVAVWKSCVWRSVGDKVVVWKSCVWQSCGWQSCVLQSFVWQKLWVTPSCYGTRWNCALCEPMSCVFYLKLRPLENLGLIFTGVFYRVFAWTRKRGHNVFLPW